MKSALIIGISLALIFSLAVAFSQTTTPPSNPRYAQITGTPVVGYCAVWTSTSTVSSTPCGSGGGGGANFVDGATPSGTVNGSNVTFTLSQSPNPAGSLLLLLNGVRQAPGGVDYTLSGSTITFIQAPATGASIAAYFRY